MNPSTVDDPVTGFGHRGIFVSFAVALVSVRMVIAGHACDDFYPAKRCVANYRCYPSLWVRRREVFPAARDDDVWMVLGCPSCSATHLADGVPKVPGYCPRVGCLGLSPGWKIPRPFVSVDLWKIGSLKIVQ